MPMRLKVSIQSISVTDTSVCMELLATLILSVCLVMLPAGILKNMSGSKMGF